MHYLPILNGGVVSEHIIIINIENLLKHLDMFMSKLYIVRGGHSQLLDPNANST